MIIINLDRLLASKKMQSAELAKELGCTEQTISRVKRGKVRAFNLNMLNAICEQFDCQPGDVLEYVSESEAVARFGQAFVDSYNAFHE